MPGISGAQPLVARARPPSLAMPLHGIVCLQQFINLLCSQPTVVVCLK